MSQLRYDICTEEECLQFLKDSFLMPVKKESFNKLTSEFVISIYERFIYDFGFNYTVQKIICFSYDHPQVYGEGFSLMNLLVYTKKLLTMANFHDFSISDLLMPKKKKTLIMFSQLIGLWVDFFSLQQHWQSIQIKYQDFPGKVNELQRELNKLREEISSRSIVITELRDKMVTIEKQIDEKVAYIDGQVERSDELKKKKVDIKNLRLEISEKNDSLVEEIKDINKKIDILSSRLIISPEIILRETEIKAVKLDERRNEKKIIEKEISLATKERNLLMDTVKEMMPIMQILEDVIDDISTLKNSCFHLVQLNDQVHSSTKRLDEFKILLQSLQKKKDNLIEQEKSYALQHKQKLDPLLANSEMIKSKIEILKKTRQERETILKKKLLFINEQCDTLKKNNHLMISENEMLKERFKELVIKSTELIKKRWDYLNSQNDRAARYREYLCKLSKQKE